MVGATDANGKSIFEGREATCFTNAEEEAVKAVDTIPFLVESRIRELGGQFVNADLWAVRCSILSSMRIIPYILETSLRSSFLVTSSPGRTRLLQVPSVKLSWLLSPRLEESCVHSDLVRKF